MRVRSSPIVAVRPSGPRGFTLIELLVVISIIGILTGLVLAGVMHSRTTAIVIRTKSDLALIETALSAYRADFGDYPRFPDMTTVGAAINSQSGGFWLDQVPDRGARLLCRTLLGPAPAGTEAVLDKTGWGDDGADGPGFRLRRNMVGPAGSQQVSGKVYGPYLQPDKFKIEYDTSGSYSNMADAKLLDPNGNPILYFPARPGTVTVNQSGTFVTDINPMSSPGTTIPQPLYNEYDNYYDTTPAAQSRAFLTLIDMQYILGDRNTNGQIDAGESAVTTQPYLLWTAGPSGKYGLQPDTTGLSSVPAGEKCDAVCNFDIPADLRK